MIGIGDVCKSYLLTEIFYPIMRCYESSIRAEMFQQQNKFLMLGVNMIPKKELTVAKVMM